MIIWTSLIVLICGMLLILGYNLEDNKLERELRSAANNYMKDNNISVSVGNAAIVYIDELIGSKYLENNDKYKDKCIKSVVVSKGILLNDYEINVLCDEDEEASK